MVLIVIALSIAQAALCALMVRQLRRMRQAEKRKAEASATFAAALQKSLEDTKVLIEKLRDLRGIE